MPLMDLRATIKVFFLTRTDPYLFFSILVGNEILMYCYSNKMSICGQENNMAANMDRSLKQAWKVIK
jgi:hypothetical protein